MQITLATAINNTKYLPEYIVVIMDADLIEYIAYQNCGEATLYSEALEWITKEYESMVNQKFDSLPLKARNAQGTQFYWVAPPLQKEMSGENLESREKFNCCLESIIKTFNNSHRVIKIRNRWNVEDSQLMANGQE